MNSGMQGGAADNPLIPPDPPRNTGKGQSGGVLMHPYFIFVIYFSYRGL
jgi:hypothetical protein